MQNHQSVKSDTTVANLIATYEPIKNYQLTTYFGVYEHNFCQISSQKILLIQLLKEGVEASIEGLTIW